jgi:2-octaprenyl-6-methoxyphenol hydroxylase
MHPVAGQGLNLAMRDIAVLADLISAHSDDLSADELLLDYEAQRAGDLKTTVRYTDSLVRLFSNDSFLLGHARAGALLAVDRLPPLRKLFTQQSMGVNYRQSRLARGLSLRV